MKTTVTLLIFLTLFALNTFAQDSPQWHLPDGAKARLGKGWISEIEYSPDGTRLAVAGIGIWLYDTTTRQEVTLLTGHIWIFGWKHHRYDDIRLWEPATGHTAWLSPHHRCDTLWDAVTGGTKTHSRGIKAWRSARMEAPSHHPCGMRSPARTKTHSRGIRSTRGVQRMEAPSLVRCTVLRRTSPECRMLEVRVRSR